MVTDFFVKVFVLLWQVILVLASIAIVAGAITSFGQVPMIQLIAGVIGAFAGLGMMSLGVSAWQKLDQIAKNTE